MSKTIPLIISPNDSEDFSEIDNSITLPIITSASIPDTGYINIFSKNGYLYVIDDNGISTPVGSSIITKTISSIESPYALDSEQVIFADASRGNIIITLPLATASNRYEIKRIDNIQNKKVTLNTSGGEKIDMDSSMKLNPLEAVILQADDNSNWWVL